MTKPGGHLTFKIFVMIMASDMLESVSQLFFKNGVLATGFTDVTLSNASAFIVAAFSNPASWIAISCHILNFCIWITVLARVDLSVAYPVGSASYIFVPLLSIFFLREDVSLARWIGIFVIISGIFFVSRSSKTAEEA